MPQIRKPNLPITIIFKLWLWQVQRTYAFVLPVVRNTISPMRTAHLPAACVMYVSPPVGECETTNMVQEPRQFVPPSGQSWTTLEELQTTHKNEFKQDENDKRIWSIFSTPQMAIGQRAVFIQTESGNVLWDCISLLDQDTIDFIKSHGGLAAIAISHPHFYSTHLEWAREFYCPVYLAYDDQEWLNRRDTENRRIFFQGETQEILPSVTMIKLGGHFPGSSVLHWNNNIVGICKLQMILHWL